MLDSLYGLDSLYYNQRNDRVIPKDQRIRELAYFKWQDAGKPSGDGLEFWLAAEDEYNAAERLLNGY